MAQTLKDGDALLRSDDGQFHFEFKVAVLGDQNVGKSSLVHAQVTESGRWHQLPSSSTVGSLGIRFEVQDFTKRGKEYRVVFWDAPGSEKFMKLTLQLCAGATAVVFVYDVCSELSFEHIDDWIGSANASVRMLIGNKTDLPSQQRKVSTQRAESYASRNGLLYAETSAVENKGIDEAFTMLMESIVELIPEPPDPSMLIKKGIRVGKLLAGSADFRKAIHHSSHSSVVEGTASETVDWIATAEGEGED